MAKMNVVFYWNYLNHHQVSVADELYKLLGKNFCFVTTLPRNKNELKGGLDYSSRPYCILAGESADFHKQALEYTLSADVCVFGACSQEYATHRAIYLPKGLSFEVGERWLKRGLLNIVSPVLRAWWLNYYRYYRKANFFKLCSSAFAPVDDERLGCYTHRHFKWGYFTKISSINNKVYTRNQPIRIMWCARFIDWKHPELAIECAIRLKDRGYKFQMEMYGDGKLRSNLETYVKNLGLTEFVRFHGNVSNDEIQQAMNNCDIFLFTSNRKEGWGAVANESMSCGCVLVASDAIGSTPYLIKDGINGFSFKSENVESLTYRVKWLLDHPEELQRLKRNAFKTIETLWSPKNAAESLLQLIDDLKHGRESSISEGPCSKA